MRNHHVVSRASASAVGSINDALVWRRACYSSAIALVVGIAGCSSPERTRSLADPGTSAITIAVQVCSNCHGVTGRSTSPNFPMLAAQVEPYLIAQLAAFKHHGRSDPDGFEYMWGVSAHLTDAQITGLAHYYFSQPPPEGRDGDPEKIAVGRHIFEEGISSKNVSACSSCHGAAAQGMATFPRLAGQHAAYIIKQLLVFQQTDTRPEGAVMKAITHGMSATSMTEVAEYLQSLGERPN